MTEINPESLLGFEHGGYELQNGRCIVSEELSYKMLILKETHPETPWQEDSTGYSWDEAGMADLFAKCYAMNTRYCPEVKSWYTYEAGRWVKDSGALLVSQKIKEFARLMALYCGEIVDEDVRKHYMQFVSRMGDRRFRDRIRSDAADCMRIEASEFDRNPYLINCLNGTFNLETMEFYEHKASDFLTMQTNFTYANCQSDAVPIPLCQRWTEFISEVTEGDQDKAEYLQRALGYSLLGENREECMFILHGKTTRNGKSTLLDAIQHMLGSYATVTPVELICKSGKTRTADDATPTLARLRAKRFVTMAESETSGRLDESAIKQYTGGEAVTGRELYQLPITFKPQFTMWLSCNDLPAVRDKSIFASERIRVIEFNRHFSQSEQDKGLKSYFESAEAMPGIFSWLVGGWRKYREQGLTMSKALRSVVAQYEKDNDLVLQFLEEKCEKDPEASTRAKSLYESYKLWCRSGGFFICSIKKFVAELQQHPEWCLEKSLRDGVAVMHGVRLKTN